MLRIALQGIHDLQTSRVRAYEALARKREDDGSLLVPGQFMSLSEPNEWVTLDIEMLSVIYQTQSLCDMEIPFFINISEFTLESSVSFLTALKLIAPIVKRRKSKTIIEISERCNLDGYLLNGRIRHLHEIGALVALDDFGTCNANLDRLMSHEWDYCKVERDSIVDVERRQESILAMDFCEMNNIRVIVERFKREKTLTHRPSPSRTLWVQGFDWSMPELHDDVLLRQEICA